MTIANSVGLINFTNDKSIPSATYDPEFALGTDTLAGGTTYTYCKAASAIAAAGTFALTGSFGAVTTTTGSTYTHDVAAPGVAANDYFWAKIVTSPL